MRRILKFLATLVVVMPVATSTIACGNSNPLPNPKPTPPIDFDATIRSIEGIFNTSLVKELNKGNLLNDNDFNEQWKNVTDYLNGIKDDDVITNSVLTSKFNELINKIIVDAISHIQADSFLANFFHNIDTKDILQLDTVSTNYKKENFDWKNNTFGITDFDTKYLPKITFWDKITSHLVIKMNYFDDNGKKQVYSFNQTYNFELYNKDAQVPEIIKLVSDNFAKQLKDYNPQIDLKEKRIDYEREAAKYSALLVDNINNKIKNKDLVISGSEVSDLGISKNRYVDSGFFGRRISSIISYNTYSYLQEDKLNFKNDFTNYSKKSEKKYATDLVDWSKRNNVKLENKNNIMFYGKDSITDWSYQGLVLDPIDLNFTMTQDNSREQQIEQVANVFSNLFATNGVLANTLKDTNNSSTFNMALSETDFTKLVNDSKSSVGQAISYKQQEIIDQGIKSKLFKENDNFMFNTHYFGGTLDKNIHDLKFNEHLNTDKNKFHYLPKAYNLRLICAFDNVYINFTKDGPWNYITDFSINKVKN